MKKTLIISLQLAVILSGCSSQKLNQEIVQVPQQKGVCNNFFVIGSGQNQVYKLQAKVVSSNLKNVVSPNAGVISYLNCSPGKQVNSKTLIAKITPDWSDPNIRSLITQKKYILDQIQNTQSIINSTKLNFSQQLNLLNSQKINLEKQIRILEDNLASLEKQKKYGIGDIHQQLKTLKDQLKDLQTSKNKLEDSKKAEISKLKISILNNREIAKSLIKNALLDIDELFGITDENKHKNDAFESYLSAKNTALKEKIKNEFIKLNSQFGKLDELSNKDFSDYIQKLDNLVQKVKKAVKASVSSLFFPQTQIDILYSKFTNYDNSLIQIKGNLDSLIKSLDTVKNTYDNQIISIQTNITSVQNNIENLEKNKLNSYLANIQVQINQVKSQLQANQTNLENVLTNIKNFKNQEAIQINQLDNQLIQLKNNLSSLNIKLSSSNIYAGINGKIKMKNISKGNKVGINTLLCQIIPAKTSLKLQVFSSIDLNERFNGNYIEVNTNKGACKIKITDKLPYKDPITQNNIYETEDFALCAGDKLDLAEIFQEGETISVKYIGKNLSQEIKVPLNFVINEINGQYIYKVLGNGNYKKVKVELGNVDGSNIKILSGLKLGDKICR